MKSRKRQMMAAVLAAVVTNVKLSGEGERRRF